MIIRPQVMRSERGRITPINRDETPPVFLPDAWSPMSSRRVVVDVFFGLIKSVWWGVIVDKKGNNKNNYQPKERLIY